MLCATLAHAADNRVSATLLWHRSASAAECLDAAALSDAVQASLHRAVFVPKTQADLTIDVNLDQPEVEHWSATLDLHRRDGHNLGHRELNLRAPHCSAINEQLALVVSLMVDVTKESVQAAAPPADAHTVQPMPARPETASATWRKRLFLLGDARVGQMPSLGRGLGVSGELGPTRGWLATLGAALWVPAQTQAALAGAKFRLVTVNASLCATHVWQARLESAWCLGQQLGWLEAQAFGYDVNRTSSALFYDLTFKMRTIWWATSAFGVQLGLGAGVPLVQDDYYATLREGTAVRLLSRPFLVPLADFGAGWRFGP